ncbi:hypothetical protein DK26_15020 [Bosea sp. WAO]|uniref:phage tail terminator-like protein n=1 Tax=Bosea sp. WAO TaxID=406341 RepID=UPI000747EEB9|nr:phage tail terminator-like protein [Bosea sp. WAO]KUL94323.1 hypothetical protein DK26_15020 [Bosea sp. WAO]
MASGVVYDAVRAFLVDHWTETLIEFENEEFEQTAQQTWIAVEMSSSVYAQQSIGAEEQNRWDEVGTLWIHVMVPAGTGSSEARRLAKAVADLFRGARLMNDDLEFRDAAIGLGGRDEATGALWTLSVTVDWLRFEA